MIIDSSKKFEIVTCGVEVESTSALSEQEVSQDLVALDEISNTIWSHHLFSKDSIILWVYSSGETIYINWPSCLRSFLREVFNESPIFDSVDFEVFEKTINSFDSEDMNDMLSMWLKAIINDFWLDESVIEVLLKKSEEFASKAFQKNPEWIQDLTSSLVNLVISHNDSPVNEEYNQRFETIPLSIIKAYMILEALKASVDNEQVLRKSLPILKRHFLQSVWFSSNLAFQMAIIKFRFSRLVTNKFPLLVNKTPELINKK